jgi:uncharacterized protein YodC (DUF2158 family)
MKRGDVVRLKGNYVVMVVEDVHEEGGDILVDVEWLDSQAHLQYHAFYVEQLEPYSESSLGKTTRRIDFGPI